MGAFASKPKDQGIVKTISRLKAKDSEILKLLLLGAGDSGKTTIFKQLKILYGSHKHGVDTRARIGIRKPLFANIISGAKTLLDGLEELQGEGLTKPLESAESLAAAKLIKSIDERVNALEPEVAEAITTLYNDENFQTTWKNRSKLQILDCWAQLAANCANYPEWGGPEWIPDEEAYILTRIRTTGVVQEIFKIENTTFQLVDVGGQRNERKKWIHCFAGVTAVLYVAASSEYDQYLFEDRSRNRLVEALGLFNTVTNSEVFEHTTMILFLNKSDIFRDKLCVRKIPLNISGEFPEAPDTDIYEVGVAWLQNKFLEHNDNPNKFVYVHLTTATDRSNIKVVLEACKVTIVRQALQRMNFYP
uniref:Uncharacterized protein n=1 Tax=Aplanochytrium stocchinoi TaxID=215587 RepID=A0A7S3PIY5_9STRA|mmetsp:Transcript_8580/g.11206  ORF Transcript_8580/g.11206 Transcript_8580/m.11206 type:complete len:362 (+) Transcript_8580:69-1154(+)